MPGEVAGTLNERPRASNPDEWSVSTTSRIDRIDQARTLHPAGAAAVRTVTRGPAVAEADWEKNGADRRRPRRPPTTQAIARETQVHPMMHMCPACYCASEESKLARFVRVGDSARASYSSMPAPRSRVTPRSRSMRRRRRSRVGIWSSHARAPSMRARVPGRGNLGPEAPAERLAACVAAEVVVAAAAGRLGHELELARARVELADRLPHVDEVERLPVASTYADPTRRCLVLSASLRQRGGRPGAEAASMKRRDCP
jgi:hypothetical protein